MFKNKLKTLILIIFSIFFMMSCGLLENQKIRIPESVVQSKAEKRFPMTRGFLLGEITLNNPVISLEEDRVHVVIDYALNLPLSAERRGKIYINSQVEYNTIKENAYLKNFVLEKITDENGKEIAGRLKEIEYIKKVVAMIAEHDPVYEYKKEHKNSKLKIKRMFIENGKFYVET